VKVTVLDAPGSRSTRVKVTVLDAPGSRSTRAKPTSCWARRGHAAGGVGGVQLDHLGAGPATGVGDRERGAGVAGDVHRVGRQLERSESKVVQRRPFPKGNRSVEGLSR
jgi:hypothetical protein